jgi:hypothetical protein
MRLATLFFGFSFSFLVCKREASLNAVCRCASGFSAHNGRGLGTCLSARTHTLHMGGGDPWSTHNLEPTPHPCKKKHTHAHIQTHTHRQHTKTLSCTWSHTCNISNPPSTYTHTHSHTHAHTANHTRAHSQPHRNTHTSMHYLLVSIQGSRRLHKWTYVRASACRY